MRYTFRSLVRTPSFTLAALLCLALGIGATTAIFSIVSAVLFRPLPYPDPEKLVRIYTDFTDFPGGGLHKFWISEPEIFHVQRAKSFTDVGAWRITGVNIGAGGEPRRVTAGFLSAGLLRALQVSPFLGHLPSNAEDRPGGAKVLLLSYSEWKAAFAGDPAVVGRSVYMNGERGTVVGVMPREFTFPPGEPDPAQVWTLLQLNPNSTSYGGHNFNALGRLRPGVSLAQARGEMAQLLRLWGASESRKNHVLSSKGHPVTMYPLHEEIVGGVRRSMEVLLGAVVFVLLIACVNVANLLLARSEGRQREIAVRRAVGASNRQLLKQFVSEGLLLSGAGAVLGLLVAAGSLRLIELLNPGSIPMADSIQMDWRVLLFTAAVSGVCGVVFGLAPMLQVSALKIFETLKTASGRSSSTTASHRFRAALVIAQMALSFVLLVGAGIMVRGFVRLQNVHAGFDPHGILTAQISLPQATYNAPAKQVQLLDRLQSELERIPGVRAASFAAGGLPPIRPVNDNTTEIEGFVMVPNGPADNVAYYQVAGDHFFDALHAHILEGRSLEKRDGDARTPGVVVNEALVRTFWPHAPSAIGHRLRPAMPGVPWFTVVGVVADIKNGGLDKPAGTEIFFPARMVSALPGGLTGSPLTLLISYANSDPASVARSLRGVVQSLDPSLPIAKVRTMDDVMDNANSRPRFFTVVLALFSGLALGLAMLGTYGLISYSVAQRTAEFGIKSALGASSQRLLWQVLRQGLTMGAAGCVLGAIGALFLTRTLEGMVFGMEASDVSSWLVVFSLMALTTALACFLPALRATKVQPIRALRYD